ncbi:MAG: integrase catalytic domain-containing protein [Chloroflexota bacterium]
MTCKSIAEYAAAIRPRYRVVGKKEKQAILDEFCLTTGYHRKSAIRLLAGAAAAAPRQGGRPKAYGPQVAAALKVLWEAEGRICSKRLGPFIPDLLEVLERQGELVLEATLKRQLLALSPATIDRLLSPLRAKGLRQPYIASQASPALKALVPLRTFSEWEDVAPGSLQADLVSHCGESTQGFYLTSLVAVDVATGWVEVEPVWGKGQARVRAAVHRQRRRLPFALRELHTDNGSEFINGLLYPYCREEGIRFSRGRPYKKNDQAYVEQKNWVLVRKTVGYDRYASKAAQDALAGVYEPLRLYVNFFQPLRKVISRERVGAKLKKRYDTARTPYQRLLTFGIIGEEEQAQLRRLYLSLNPVRLRAQIEATLAQLWRLAERGPATKTAQTVAGG